MDNETPIDEYNRIAIETIKAAAAELGPLDKKDFEKAYKEIRTVIEQRGNGGIVALALIGAELQAAS